MHKPACAHTHRHTYRHAHTCISSFFPNLESEKIFAGFQQFLCFNINVFSTESSKSQGQFIWYIFFKLACIIRSVFQMIPSYPAQIYELKPPQHRVHQTLWTFFLNETVEWFHFPFHYDLNSYKVYILFTKLIKSTACKMKNKRSKMRRKRRKQLALPWWVSLYNVFSVSVGWVKENTLMEFPFRKFDFTAGNMSRNSHSHHLMGIPAFSLFNKTGYS